MIPVPPATKAKILAWLPHLLAGYDYPVIETDNIVPDLSAPAITFYFSSAGTPSQFSHQPLRTVRRPDLTKDEYWGQYHFATMNVVLRSHDKDEIESMWSDFVEKCLATRRRGFSDLTKSILRGSNATNMVGYCNHVDVYGGTIDDDGKIINERKTHNLIHAWAEPDNDWEIKSYGLLKAPPVVIPNASQERCQEVADKLLEWYRQYKDVPTVKVVGKAPGLLSKVAYRPWNGAVPPIKCDGLEEAEMAHVLGLVTRRVVDISAEGGFVSTLDVTTNFLGVNKPLADQDIMNFYSENRNAIDQNENIDPFPGVLFV